MANVDFSSQYRRLVQLFWDPEPSNDSQHQEAIWCLGARYESSPKRETSSPTNPEEPPAAADILSSEPVIVTRASHAESLPPYNPDGVAMTAPVTEEARGWPVDFLNDFESRLWFTYRSHFPPIEKSTASSASSSLTIAVRLRNQLVDQGGFTSDAGFGCMIRSGQCLLANAISILRLGRGNSPLIST